jgi:hypothetical protein
MSVRSAADAADETPARHGLRSASGLAGTWSDSKTPLDLKNAVHVAIPLAAEISFGTDRCTPRSMQKYHIDDTVARLTIGRYLKHYDCIRREYCIRHGLSKLHAKPISDNGVYTYRFFVSISLRNVLKPISERFSTSLMRFCWRL